MDSFGVILVKVLVALALSPLWYPFLKVVWEEMNLALEEDGGIFGRIPSQAQLERMREGRRWRPDPMVHEPYLTADNRARGRRVMRGRATTTAPRASVRRPGF